MKRKNRDTPGRRIAQAIIAQYKPQSFAEMQAALKEVFGPMFEAMLNGEMESYLGYEPNSREEKETLFDYLSAVRKIMYSLSYFI